MKKQFLAVTSSRKLLFIADRIRSTSIGVFGLNGDYSFAQFPIMKYFLENPDSTPQIKRLSEYSGLSSGAISQAVDLYVAAKILERKMIPENRRSTGIMMSSKGKAMRKETLALLNKRFAAFEASVEPDKLAKFRDVLCFLFQARTGTEHLAAKHAGDLCKLPSEIRPLNADETNPSDLPSWMLLIHFADALRFPVMHFNYASRSGRTTLGKLRIMNYLFAIHGRKNLPMIKDFAERFHLPSAAVTQTLNALYADGLVNRIPGPKDRRVTLISLTDKGEHLYRVCTASYVKFMKEVFEKLPQDQVEAFISVLEAMAQFLTRERFVSPYAIAAESAFPPISETETDDDIEKEAAAIENTPLN
jgi:DNA-binding MarR family transcriptional regulator